MANADERRINNRIPKDLYELELNWLYKIGCMKLCHYKAAIFYGHANTVASTLLILVTAGITTISTLRLTYENVVFEWIPLDNAGWEIFSIGLGLFSVVLASLQSVFRYAEKAEKHRAAGAAYARLEFEIELLLIPSSSEMTPKKKILDIYEEWARRTGENPIIPQHIYEEHCGCLDRHPCNKDKNKELPSSDNPQETRLTRLLAKLRRAPLP